MSRPIHHHATTASHPDNGQRRGARTGAALGAPGHVHHRVACAGDRALTREKRCKRAGPNLRRSARRRAGAGNNPAPRIGRTDDEPEPLGDVGQTRGATSGHGYQQKYMVRSGAQTPRA